MFFDEEVEKESKPDQFMSDKSLSRCYTSLQFNFIVTSRRSVKQKELVHSLESIRPCHIYKEELYECDRTKGRFQQYFVDGVYQDCTSWLKDYNRCILWTEKKDEKAYEELIQSERVRRLQRLKGHYQNDVWKKRDKPPENWNAPLPEWLEKQNANSFLTRKATDIKNGTVNDIDVKLYYACSIL